MDLVMKLAFFDICKQLVAAHKYRCKQECRITSQVEHEKDFNYLKNPFHRIHSEDIIYKIKHFSTSS